MYGKRFVTGDRQKACLFEQKGSYMASIKDSNGQFKTLQLGTNRPVAFKQFFAAASAAGYDMRSVAKEQGVDPEVKLNREQRRQVFGQLGSFIANLHGALWPCAIMLPLAALLDSKLDSNARIALAVTVLLTIASAMLNPHGLDVLSLPFKTIGTSDVATVAVPELKPMFSIVPVEAVILIVISVVPVIFHAKCLGFKKAVFSFETMMISGLLFLSLMTWRNELLLLGILMIVYSTWCWKLEPKCKVSSKMLSRIVLFSISVVALEFGAVLFYSTLSATDQKSISIERAFQARERMAPYRERQS